jgi:hypothetical protein
VKSRGEDFNTENTEFTEKKRGENAKCKMRNAK